MSSPQSSATISRHQEYPAGLSSAERSGDFEQSLPSEKGTPWQGDLLQMFLRNQMHVAPTMPILVVLMGVTAMLWTPVLVVLAWMVGAIGCNALQILMCRYYFRQERTLEEQRDWIGMMSALELMLGTFWVVPLFLFWPNSDGTEGSFLLAAIMAVSAVRFLIVSNFMPVLIAGTGVITIGIALRCVSQGEPIYFALAGIIITLEVFFLFIARQLQETARDMIIFRGQKDVLIAELKLARDHAESEKQKADTANRAKSSFLANMSHELRTPLNAILGFSEVLEREMFGPLSNNTYKDYAGDIHTSGRYLLTLINDILDLSRIEAGRREFREEPIALGEAFAGAVRLLEKSAASKSIAIEIDVAETMPRILGDSRAVGQVIINLLNNAIKFTQNRGHVTLTARRANNGAIELSIKDNGPGIPAEEIEQAMSAFTRGSLATKKAVDGAGLGLSIVKGIMELHDGSVSITSTAGNGTEVICEFPAKRVLSGPRGELQAPATVQSDSQRRLISITG
jgi:two-component system cell cycle sensor histidine kinase PleC